MYVGTPRNSAVQLIPRQDKARLDELRTRVFGRTNGWTHRRVYGIRDRETERQRDTTNHQTWYLYVRTSVRFAHAIAFNTNIIQPDQTPHATTQFTPYHTVYVHKLCNSTYTARQMHGRRHTWCMTSSVLNRCVDHTTQAYNTYITQTTHIQHTRVWCCDESSSWRKRQATRVVDIIRLTYTTTSFSYWRKRQETSPGVVRMLTFTTHWRIVAIPMLCVLYAWGWCNTCVKCVCCSAEHYAVLVIHIVNIMWTMVIVYV